MLSGTGASRATGCTGEKKTVSTCTTLRTLAVGGAILVLLTACGGGNTEDRKDLSPPAAASTAERPAGGKQASGVGGGRAAGSEETAESRTNERGNVVKALGEEGSVVGETGTQLLTFAVDAITVDPACSPDWQEYGTPVEPGHHLVAVQLRAATSPAASEEDYLSVSSYDFKYIGADGITVDELSS